MDTARTPNCVQPKRYIGLVGLVVLWTQTGVLHRLVLWTQIGVHHRLVLQTARTMHRVQLTRHTRLVALVALWTQTGVMDTARTPYRVQPTTHSCWDWCYGHRLGFITDWCYGHRLVLWTQRGPRTVYNPRDTPRPGCVQAARSTVQVGDKDDSSRPSRVNKLHTHAV